MNALQYTVFSVPQSVKRCHIVHYPTVIPHKVFSLLEILQKQTSLFNPPSPFRFEFLSGAPSLLFLNIFLRIFVILKSTNYRLNHAGNCGVHTQTHSHPPNSLGKVSIIKDWRRLWMSGSRGGAEREITGITKFVLGVQGPNLTRFRPGTLSFSFKGTTLSHCWDGID